ncbi:MAG: TerB family tellurite resistance protein [Alphaproteobacteria bacterium]|nr:TerB family tellurite resistance protein [Alphaproteobacteria bacterium]
MLRRVAELLGFGNAPAALDQDEARLAAAALLMEATLADEAEHPAERAVAERLVADRFGLCEAASRALLDLGRAAAQGSTDLVRHTRVLKQALDAEERIEVITALWQVVLADDAVDDYEDALVRQVAGLLHVSDGDRARARRRAMKRRTHERA